MSIQESVNTLVDVLAALPGVRAIGTPGKTLPKPVEGDIDLFIYCDIIPSECQREVMLKELSAIDHYDLGVYSGGNWGIGDFAVLQGVDTSLMFFTIAETRAEIKALLRGERLDRENNYYYPLGRCAMLKNIRELHDTDEVFSSFKALLEEYPVELSRAVIDHHLEKLDDVEDLLRAVGRRDVLFYHFAIELALDSFLQALFALNKAYFPSRKRSLEYIDGFLLKPRDCEQRLLHVISLGVDNDSLQQSYALWQELVAELEMLCGVR